MKGRTDSTKAYLGISLGRLYYSTARLKAYCAWAAVNAPNDFGFLIGDDIYVYTLRAFSHLNAAAAAKRAEQKGSEVQRQLDRLSLAKNLSHTVVRWRELTSFPRYQAIVAAASQLLENKPAFRADVRSQAAINLRRRLERAPTPGANGKATRWRLLERYIIEEIAGLVTMSEDRGYPLEVYPGKDLQIVQDVYAGKWPSLQALLPAKPKRDFYPLELE